VLLLLQLLHPLAKPAASARLPRPLSAVAAAGVAASYAHPERLAAAVVASAADSGPTLHGAAKVLHVLLSAAAFGAL
jgi:hypothetical protein